MNEAGERINGQKKLLNRQKKLIDNKLSATGHELIFEIQVRVSLNLSFCAELYVEQRK